MPTFLSSNLKFLRAKFNKTQSDIGFELKKAHTSIGNWEKGISEPSLAEIDQIARIFEIKAADLLYNDLSVVLNSARKEVVKKAPNVLEHVPNHVLESATKYHAGPGISVGMPAVVTVDTSGAESVVFVPVKARAGYLLGYADQEFITSLPAYRLPGYNNGTYRAFEVDGNSMFNTLHDGDRVIARWATDADFRDDRVYVIVTKSEGILVKRCIFRDGRIVAKSDNNHKGEYPTIVLEMSEISELWYVVERMTKQLAQPGEIYRRLVDLEGRVALIDDRLNRT